MPPTNSNNDKPSVLKTTRQAKGLTLDIVHEATKIPMDVLKAIEEGYSVRILSPFYYRGFIKIYAGFLGLDVGETYKHYGLDQAPKATVPAPSAPSIATRRKAHKPPKVTLGQTQEWLPGFFNPKNIKRILKVIGILVVLFLLVRMGGCIVSHLNKKAVPASKSVSVVLSPVKEMKVHKLESVKAPSENHKVEVAVRAMRDTWVQVKTDDKVVFQTTLTKGSMEDWSADNRIELSGRNIDQLDMEVNGKHIGSLGGGERRIKKVLITKEGLTVKK